jgi:hypothetical protein
MRHPLYSDSLELVPNSNFLLKIHWEHSTYRTIVLELFLKTRIFLKKYHKLMRFLGYFMVFFKKILVFKNNSRFLIIVR